MERQLYALVEWPEVQELMEYDWFIEEAFPVGGYDYVVPVDRLKEVGLD